MPYITRCELFESEGRVAAAARYVFIFSDLVGPGKLSLDEGSESLVLAGTLDGGVSAVRSIASGISLGSLGAC